jgi:hypothetical protein
VAWRRGDRAGPFERAPALNQRSAVAISLAVASLRDDARRARLSPPTGEVDPEVPVAASSAITAVAEAPTAFDNLTNGFDPQGPRFESLNEDNVVPLRSFNDNRFIFEEIEGPPGAQRLRPLRGRPRNGASDRP